jgi:hypothetical protein
MKRFSLAFLFVLLSLSFALAGVGDTAPEFDLKKLDGGRIKLSELKGKVVYINFFGFN